MTDKDIAIKNFKDNILKTDKECGAPMNELSRCVNTAMINSFIEGYDKGFQDSRKTIVNEVLHQIGSQSDLLIQKILNVINENTIQCSNSKTDTKS